MAYFCLTVVEATAGGRAEAAKALAVDPEVLSKIGELSSTRGDTATARKAHASRNPLTSQERAWLEDVVRQLALRLGHTGTADTLAPLTLRNL